ncbi:MAG: DegT/DnrJ/EryC1/StrS family aminotransferase [bacterium]|nr:DegT/DnrJ/EryC1/StrS family aminotransferase [bacterium]
MSIEFNYTTKTLKSTPAISSGSVFGELDKDIVYTFSGKSSLTLLLRYYQHIGKLKDRSDQILVPQWLGDPVYMVMHEHCFPTTFMNEKVKGIMVYHQWGFPQDMDYIKKFCEDNKLFFIEDCAHTHESYYKGQRLGTFGESSFFSLGKFFSSVVGGSIYTQSDSIKKFIEEKFQEDDEKLSTEVFNRRHNFDVSSTQENVIELRRDYAVYSKLLKCPEYSLAISQQEVAGGAMLKRRAHYELYKKAFGGSKYLSDLIKEDVVPWVVPLFFDEIKNKKVVSALRDAGIKTGVYHFDVNRNMFKPDFKECVPLPCHQGMTTEDVLKVIDIVKCVTE